MTRKTRILIALGLTAPELIVSALIYFRHRVELAPLQAPVRLTGAVLKQSSDPINQTPLAGVLISARTAKSVVNATSDPAGRFEIPVKAEGKPVLLTFQASGYKTLQLEASQPGDQLYIAHLEALANGLRKSSVTGPPARPIDIKDVRVRYSFKDESTMGVGSFAKRFTVPSVGNNVPCNGQQPCSPDARWKASTVLLPLDAEEGNEFRNVRVSCIAGPCAFTKIDAGTFAHAARKMAISILNWSDSAVILVEADITRTMVAEQVRESYPFIVEQSMSFSLPSTAEGLSIEANVANEHIVYPLGPPLLLSWASCSVELAPGSSQFYRCNLKPGYHFLQPS